MTELELARKRKWIQRIADATKEAQVLFRYEVQSGNNILYASQSYFDRWIRSQYQVTIVDVLEPDPKSSDSNLKILRTEDLPILDKNREPGA